MSSSLLGRIVVCIVHWRGNQNVLLMRKILGEAAGAIAARMHNGSPVVARAKVIEMIVPTQAGGFEGRKIGGWRRWWPVLTFL